MLRSVGQLPLPEGRRPEQELLGELHGLVRGIPTAKEVSLALEQAEQGLKSSTEEAVQELVQPPLLIFSSPL